MVSGVQRSTGAVLRTEQPTGERLKELSALAEILTNGVIRSRHTFVVEKQGKDPRGRTDPPWYYLPRRRRSLAAVQSLAGTCSRENLEELLRHRFIALDQLELFLERTPLGESQVAIISNVVAAEKERRRAKRRADKAADAASFSSGLDHTGELQRIIAAGSTTGYTHPTAADGEPRFRRGVEVHAHR